MAPTVRSFPTRREMGVAAAAEAAQVLRQALTAAPVARAVFAAAPSQAEMLDVLASHDLDWSRIEAFHMDEYVGLPADAPQLFGPWLERRLFRRVPFRAVHLLRPGDGVEACCAAYAALLDTAPLDLVCLGIGVNGHLAFNDPPVADLADPLDVKPVQLDETCRQQQVDDGAFPALADVPREAVTLTVPRLLRAERLVCTVPGPAKRAAVRAALHGPVGTACPASALRLHDACALFLDADSTPG